MSNDDSEESPESDFQSRFAAYLTDEVPSESDEEHGLETDALIEKFNNQEKKRSNDRNNLETDKVQQDKPGLEKFIERVEESEKIDQDNDPFVWESTENKSISSGKSDYSQSHSDVEVPIQLEELAHVLVLGRSNVTNSDAICRRLLYNQNTMRNVLIVNVTGKMAERMNICLGDNSEQINKTGIINFGTGETTPSTSSLITGSANTDSIVMRNISNPSDLARLGITISRLVSEWKETTQHPTSICFHSLTPLLHHVQTRTLFQFLFTLIQSLGTNRITAHYHLDPAVHGEQATGSLQPLFDSVIRISEQGQIEVVPTQ